jgi:rfaE bifunctional protein kinase chain/domain
MKHTKDRIVFISGHFNVLHPGHLRLFKFAREFAGKLIVGVESDSLAGSAAFINENLRLEGVIANAYVDSAFLMNVSAADTIAVLKPNIVIKGHEFESLENPESKILESYGGELLFASGDSVFSSSDLIRMELKESSHSKFNLPNSYLSRHTVDLDNIKRILKNFEKLKIVVVGDLIVDEYIACEPLGMSREDATIVVTPLEQKKFIGGAGIVAAHAAGLGAKVAFVSVTGEDDNHFFSARRLSEFGVNAKLLVDPARPTTHKQRFRANGKTLLRVSHLHQGVIPDGIKKEFLNNVFNELEDANLLVFSDFNYGCLPQILVDQIIDFAKKNGVMLAADSQSSSQIGDVSRFKGVDLLTPTEYEARLSIRNQDDGLVILADKLKNVSEARYLLLKLGGDGLLIQTNEYDGKAIYTDQIPALNKSPIDTAGAGDSLLITSAMMMAGGANIWEMGLIGSIAAAIQVGRLGNTPLDIKELIEQISQ